MTPDRRDVLAGALAALAAGALPRAVAPAAASGFDGDAFLELSRRVVGRERLDPVLAEALREAFARAGALDALAAIDPEADGTARRALLKGWYLGTVSPRGPSREGSEDLERQRGEDEDEDDDDAPPDVVVGYEATLMGAVVADLVPLRSYCGGPPGFWASPPDDPDLAGAGGGG